MNQPCRVPGCGADVTSRYSHYCQSHKTRLRRHGAVDQQGITAADLKPYLKRLKARFEKNRDNPAWGQLDGRWLAVVDHARGILAAFERGKAGTSYERAAAHQVVKLAGTTRPREVVEV